MFLLGAETSFAQKHHIDLTEWGCKPRPNFRPVVQRYSQCISVGPGGRVAVGFVTRDRTGLATRTLPPLSLHVIQFGSEGAFLRQDIVPTSSWDDNSILFTARGDLLVRSGEKLRLFSAMILQMSEIELKTTTYSPIISWEIFPRADRSAVLLYNFRREETSLQLLNSVDLAPLKRCVYDPY